MKPPLVIFAAFILFQIVIIESRVSAAPQQAGSTSTATDQKSVDTPAMQTVDPTKFVTTVGYRFVDVQRREILLRGVNVVEKSGDREYLSWHTEEDFARLRDWGMNVIRLGIIWDGLEPQAGVFNDNYLAEIDERIRWAEKHGLYIVLDMHQDLFSVLYSDGAPAWATLTDGLPHIQASEVWSDAYLTSPAVQRAFDNFWANKRTASGQGIQDHYAAAWQYIAKRYANSPVVIGYDLMNEPFPGSLIQSGMSAMVAKAAELLKATEGDRAPSAEEVMRMWMDSAGRSRLLKAMEDRHFYQAILDASGEVYKDFESEILMSMYQRVTNAIRQVDPNHIIFLEAFYPSNMGVYSRIQPVMGPNGRRDPQQAYAPHGYDLVVDTPSATQASSARIDLIFNRHQETARRLGMPMLVGEWGAFYAHGVEILPVASHIAKHFEQLGCSDTYWDYSSHMPHAAYLSALQRAAPERLSGMLISYENDPDTGALRCSWREDASIKAPTVIYVPRRLQIANRQVLLSPPGEGYNVKPATEGSENYRLTIPPLGFDVERSLTIH